MLFRVCIVLLMSVSISRAVQFQDQKSFTLTAHQRLAWDGRVVDAKVERDSRGETEAKPIGVEFSVIPTRMLSAMTWNNPVTGGVEQRIWPAIEHPIPVLRAGHVRFFEKAPDLKTLAVDMIQQDPNEVEIKPQLPVAIVGDGAGRVAMITFTELSLPKDRPGEWKLVGTIQTISLVEHIPDPIADRGRAVLAKEPLTLTGELIYGTRNNAMSPTSFFSLDLNGDVAAATPKSIAKDITEGRVADNGTIVDRVDMRTLRMTSAAGKTLGEIKLEDDIAEFNISRDGTAVVLTTQLRKDPQDDWSPREVATVVYSIRGKQHAVVWEYDDAAFLPDGNLVVTAKWAGEGLYVADLKAGTVKRVEFKDVPEGLEPSPQWWPRTPAVSPDGKWIAYASGRSVYVVGIDGRGWTPVWTTTGDPEPQSVPVFSPDSKYIAMIVTPLNVMNGPGQLMVFDINAHVRQPITAAKDANSEIPLTWRR